MDPDVPIHQPEPAIAGSVVRLATRWRQGALSACHDHVAEEVPVALVYNDAPFAVMMATPCDLVDFATGFTISEGIVADGGDIAFEHVETLLEGIEIRMRIPADRAALLECRRRTLSGRSGCGICGSELLEATLRQPDLVTAEPRIAAAALEIALQQLHEAQVINTVTGATHAAGWATRDGRLLFAREDVGRHNALDKLIGAMHAAAIAPDDGFLVVTSRASYEMAMKAASAGMPVMVAISAPTALAIALAERANLTLVGFARDSGHVVYTHPHRLHDTGAGADRGSDT